MIEMYKLMLNKTINDIDFDGRAVRFYMTDGSIFHLVPTVGINYVYQIKEPRK